MCHFQVSLLNAFTARLLDKLCVEDWSFLLLSQLCVEDLTTCQPTKKGGPVLVSDWMESYDMQDLMTWKFNHVLMSIEALPAS